MPLLLKPPYYGETGVLYWPAVPAPFPYHSAWAFQRLVGCHSLACWLVSLADPSSVRLCSSDYLVDDGDRSEQKLDRFGTPVYDFGRIGFSECWFVGLQDLA